VPARSKSADQDAARRTILLLEEYDALIAAIGSALKKFAPQYHVATVRTLAEAERLAFKLNPELFVLDVDPPWAGLTNFLEQMRAGHPKARALVVGAAFPAEIAIQRRSAGALQFIEKPFELQAFGAGVQALLGPWNEKQGRGTLRNLGVLDIVLAHCAARATVILNLRSRTRSGEIYVAGGEVVHAATGRLESKDALLELIEWSMPRMSEKKWLGSGRRTITNWQTIIIEALREASPELAETLEPAPESISRRAAKKIVVIDDTEMLLIFVQDVLTSAHPEWQITTASSATEGLQKIERIIPDLVLLDYSLPDLNGDELCERLLQNEWTTNVPILMMSGHVPEMNAAAARLPNIVAKIEKPFFSEALVDLVRQTLETEYRFAAAIKTERLAPDVLEPEPAPAPPPPATKTAKEPASALAKSVNAPTTLAPAEPHIERHLPLASTTIRVAATDGNAALLGIFLEVLAMQLTPQLQIGAIRARPASSTVSLRLQSATTRSALGSEIGFQLGPAKLNNEGRISSLRVIPTITPFQPAPMRTSFEIGGVALIPNETRARVQLTPAGTTPMTMELFAHLELGAVELSQTFQVAQLILNWHTNAVRVTLNPKAPEKTAAKFDLRVLRLDQSGRLAEVLLHPIR
jgi:DNA-binding response OmpR family regulator